VGGLPIKQAYLGKVIGRVPAVKAAWDRQVEVTPPLPQAPRS